MVDIKPEKGIQFEKKVSISSKLIVFAKALVRVSPKISEIIASPTSLAPFESVVGTRFEEIVANLEGYSRLMQVEHARKYKLTISYMHPCILNFIRTQAMF